MWLASSLYCSRYPPDLHHPNPTPTPRMEDKAGESPSCPKAVLPTPPMKAIAPSEYCTYLLIPLLISLIPLLRYLTSSLLWQLANMGLDLELCARCCVFLFRCHTNRIVTTQSKSHLPCLCPASPYPILSGLLYEGRHIMQKCNRQYCAVQYCVIQYSICFCKHLMTHIA